MNALLFSKVYPRFSKMDKNKCPFLEKGLRELKFSYIITYSASAFPIFAMVVTIMLLYILKYILKCEHNGVARIGNSSIKYSNISIIFYMYYIYLDYK